METKEIIDEIMKLSIKKRPQIIEKTAKTIQRDDEKAVDQLYDDYRNDKVRFGS